MHELIWILNDLLVDETARGKGVVDELLNATTDLALEAGCVSIGVATQHSNQRAQRPCMRAARLCRRQGASAREVAPVAPDPPSDRLWLRPEAMQVR